MGWLETLGIRRQKTRPVGTSLERDSSKREEEARRRAWAVKITIFVVLALLTLAAFPGSNFYDYTVQVGDQWRQETLEAPFGFAIYKHPDSLKAERRAVRNRTPPYFREVQNAKAQLRTNRDTVAQQFDRLFNTYKAYLFNKRRGNQAEARRDSQRFARLRRYVRPKLSPEQWQGLRASYRARLPGGAEQTSRETPTGPRLDDEVLQAAYSVGAQLQNVGVLNVPLDSVRTEKLIVRNEQAGTERTERKEYVYGLNEVNNYAREKFQNRFENAANRVDLAMAFFRAIFQPSLQYMRGTTVNNWQDRMERISPTRGKVAEGNVIVRKGQLMTRSIKRKLASLEQAKSERGMQNLFWQRRLGQFLLILATFLTFFLYLYLMRRPIFRDNALVFLIALLFAVIIGLFALALRMPTVAMYAVPVAIASLILAVMFDARVGLWGTLTLALIGGQLLGYDFEFFFATFFAGVLGILSVRDIKNRGRVFFSAVPVFIGYLIVLTATWLFLGTPTAQYTTDLLMTGINAVLVIMGVYPLIWMFERVFGRTTDLTLLELSDTNRPLLKELSIRAPGTFNHSLQVANLAEAAADAIGADALQVRVGALYHDIGKMLKPEYFAENQRQDHNPHEQLKPRMSALIIASHVKEGLEIGRQYNLPRRVLDFIPTHHGTSRIEFFYQKALEGRTGNASDVLESEFRYPGPRPFNKETGIMMLADSVEAASRSLDDPTRKRLRNLIDSIAETYIDDGQLDRTNLTFEDIDTIKETFLSLLTGIYHVRVKYPDQDEDEEGEQESKEEAGGEEGGAGDDDGVPSTSLENRRDSAPQPPDLEGDRAASDEEEAAASSNDEASDEQVEDDAPYEVGGNGQGEQERAAAEDEAERRRRGDEEGGEREE
jgi:putative nucleotidyltransferase with HDIG domain